MQRPALLALALIGCSTDPSDMTPDASTPVDSGSNPTCEVEASADRTALSAGSRLFVDIAAEDGAAVSLAAPAGWRKVSSGASRFRLEPGYSERGAFEVTATATCANGASASDTISIEVRPLAFRSLPSWSGADGPSEREHPALMLDGDDRVVLFGGFAFEPRQYTVVDDLWAYDLEAETWTALTSSAAPAFAAGRFAPIEGARAALYSGGSDQRNEQPFTLVRLDVEDGSATWSTVSPIDQPDGSSSLGSFVYDPPRDRYLSLCGYGWVGIHCDVEAYLVGENRWTLVSPQDGPPEARYGFFYANDLETERVILWSGGRFSFNGSPNPAQDTWAYELAEDRWVKLLDTGPPGRRNGCSALDPIGHRFFVWGGTPDARTTSPGLWVLDLDRGEEEWVEVVPDGDAPERSSCSAIYDPARERILFGFGNTTAAIYADWQVLEL